MKRLWGIILLVIILGLTIPLVEAKWASKKAFTPDNLIRIHVIANSNSRVDQIIKMKVKDRLVNWLSPRLAGCDSASESQEVLSRNLDEITRVAAAEILANNGNYSARAVVGEFVFPTRQYGDLVLPEGRYKALRVVLGEGKGHNWWCVLYPPLCLDSGGKNKEDRTRRVLWLSKWGGGKRGQKSLSTRENLSHIN